MFRFTCLPSRYFIPELFQILFSIIQFQTAVTVVMI